MILKGTLLGTMLGMVLFFVFSLAYLWYWIRPSADKAISLNTLKELTIRDPFYWLAFVGMIGIGCLIVRALPSRG
ncbi:MAG TPA: hypothetical protein VOA64_08955 [Candidatus Dormibacteraeota bacterium]|nr:hypothetical protein [Candidatus Dormibacteraeota bacterium]